MPFEEGVYRTEEGGQFINTTGGFMIIVPEKLQFENVAAIVAYSGIISVVLLSNFQSSMRGI